MSEASQNQKSIYLTVLVTNIDLFWGEKAEMLLIKDNTCKVQCSVFGKYILY